MSALKSTMQIINETLDTEYQTLDSQALKYRELIEEAKSTLLGLNESLEQICVKMIEVQAVLNYMNDKTNPSRSSIVASVARRNAAEEAEQIG